MKNKPSPKGVSLRFMMVLFVFLVMLASIVIIGAIMGPLLHFGLLTPFGNARNPLLPIVTLLAVSTLMGTALTALVGNRMLKPLRGVIAATQQVAAGDFSVRLQVGNVPELDELNRSFNKMVEELAGIETLRSDFVSNFSHEFKTPIVSIRGFAKLLKDENLPAEERAEYADIILREAERLTGLATNVLNLSKLENIGILTDKKHFFLDEQIRRTAALLEPRWREKDLSVQFDLANITIESDEELLQQVWMNLLDNAIKFTGTGGHIALRLKMDGPNAVFVIEDDGCGMDEAALAHAFDKFYQADASHAGPGNGLGLSLVQRAVALCGGTVQAQSRPGAGSRFTITLPAG